MLKQLIFGVVSMLAIAGWALAQDKGNLAITLVHQKVVTSPDGKELLRTADVAKPSDVIEYKANYKNTGKSPIKSLEATMPIPGGTELISDSVKPIGAKASLDGVKFEAIPLKRKVKKANGQSVEELVPVQEYRYLRWYPGVLAAGKAVSYTARVKVTSDTGSLAVQGQAGADKKR